LPVSIRYVDTKAKKTDDGKDYLSIAPNGYVPALRLAGGQGSWVGRQPGWSKSDLVPCHHRSN
jgi:glutathione S-transferase